MNVRTVDPKSIDLEEFLNSWFDPKENAVETFESSPVTLPDGLREWFRVISQWKIPLKGVKTIFPLSDMVEEDGKYIFMGDHGGWSWAFDPNVPLTVYEAKDDEPWRSLRGDWGDFLFFHVFTEAIETAPVVAWCADISESNLRRALNRFDEVSFTGSKWPGPGWRWYGTDGLIADAGPKQANRGRFAVTIGAKSKDFVDRLDLPIGAGWKVRKNC
ncbi:hypothetical protein ACFHW2_42360 [Actinomadura sp. LOL_016]|uniref:hypothetical protein n=1 Tax=unclassified Actinomadura TaxID=2626254 RepID=UPI003A80392A